MADDFLDRLEAAIQEARKHRPRKSRIREVPRPRQEIDDALHRWHGIVSYYEPALQPLTLTALDEYAATRMLRESITEPECVAADFFHFRRDYFNWWEQWRSQ